MSRTQCYHGLLSIVLTFALRLSIFGSFLFLSSIGFANGPLCSHLFPSTLSTPQTSHPHENTIVFEAYISNLIQAQTLKLSDLKAFQNNLSKGLLTNPIPHYKNNLGLYFEKASDQIHYEAFQKLIEEAPPEVQLLKENINKLILKTEDSKQKRHQTQRETQVSFQQMEFHKIETGTFMMGNPGHQNEVKITKPFFMMSTLITQFMWAKLKITMGEKDLDKINPSYFKKGVDSTVLKIETFEVPMRPNYPLENVSWIDVTKFIAGLNKLSKSNSVKNQSLLKQIIPDHQKGDVYSLPTSAQWEFVMRNRGQADKRYFDRDDSIEVNLYAWQSENSNKSTHEVATLNPRIISGKEFFDLEGNIYELTNTRAELKNGEEDPQGPVQNNSMVMRGGCWGHSDINLKSGGTDQVYVDSVRNTQGFRLIRIIDPEKVEGL